ncbi:hypothetical protein ACROYT_G015029 [Oculina patagonica]
MKLMKGTWEGLKSQRIECKSRKCDKKLYAYGRSVPLKVISCFEAKVVLGDSVCCDQREITTAIEKKYSNRAWSASNKKSINSVSSDIVEEFKDCFTGKLKDYQLKLLVKEDIAPVVQPLRRPPFDLRDKLGENLISLEPKRRPGKAREMEEIAERMQEGVETILLGDSITKNMERFAHGYMQYFPASTVINAGIPGDTVEN